MACLGIGDEASGGWEQVRGGACAALRSVHYTRGVCVHVHACAPGTPGVLWRWCCVLSLVERSFVRLKWWMMYRPVKSAPVSLPVR